MARQALEDILQQTREKGPRVVSELGVRLNMEEAEQLSAALKKEGIDVAPYDFPSTKGVWQASDTNGVPYKLLATKQLIKVLAEREKVDFRTVEGFKKILPYLTKTSFKEVAINDWGTKLEGMFMAAYVCSSSAAVLDLVRADKEFAKIRQKNLQPYDFPAAPHNTWTDGAGKPTETARAAIKQLIKILAKKRRVDPTTAEGFKRILPELTADNFKELPINIWGTTLNGLLYTCYDSRFAAVLDVIESDGDFVEIKNRGLKPYDFLQAPNNMWNDKEGKLTETCRDATKQFIRILAQRKDVDYKTVEGFKAILPDIKRENFREVEINYWGTKLSSLLSGHNTISKIILDLINNDAEFAGVREKNLQPYDFLHATRNTWKDRQGNVTDMARAAVKQLIVTLAKQVDVDYRTFEGFREILPHLISNVFQKMPINEWGTTLCGLQSTYFDNTKSCGSISTFILDLISKDEELAEIRKHDLQPYDFPRAPPNTWKDKKGRPTELTRKATKQLIEVLAQNKGANYRTFDGFKQILPELTLDNFHTVRINEWGTTLTGMLSAYDGNAITAILDLLKIDPELKGINGRITKNMLNGYTNTRADRADGDYSMYALRKKLTRGGVNLTDYGFHTFLGNEKQSARETLAQAAKERFGAQPVAYFGLEGPSFGSYFALAQAVKINAKESLIPERNKRHCNVMEQIKKMVSVNRLLNGSSLRPLELILSSAEEALQKTEKKFDLVFLDWLGFLSQAGMREMDLAYQHLNKNGMIALTLNVHALHEGRYRRLTGRQGSQDDYVQQWAQQNGLQATHVDYVGGEKIRMPMRMYLLKK